MTRAKAISDTVTVHIPFRLVKRGGRKEMQMPYGAPSQRKMDNTLVKALARAFRWKRSPARFGGSECWGPVSLSPSPTWPNARALHRPK